jgi:hypothetical protein
MNYVFPGRWRMSKWVYGFWWFMRAPLTTSTQKTSQQQNERESEALGDMWVCCAERWILNEVKCCITFSLVANNLYFDFETLYHINEHRPWWCARARERACYKSVRASQFACEERADVYKSAAQHGDCCEMQIFQFSPRSLICHTDWCDLISSLDSDCNQFWTLRAFWWIASRRDGWKKIWGIRVSYKSRAGSR